MTRAGAARGESQLAEFIGRSLSLSLAAPFPDNDRTRTLHRLARGSGDDLTRVKSRSQFIRSTTGGIFGNRPS